MKKFFTVAASLILSAAMLTACGSSAAPAATTEAPETTAAAVTQAPETTEETKSFHIAIVQQLDHASLDEIRLAVEDELTKAAADKGFQVSYKEFNGQNDNTVLNQIGAQVVSDKYDAIIPIASLAAQCMVTAADGTNTPIIYAAVSDPATAGLTDIPNVTGTSDALNTAFILDMMLAAQPDVKTVGLLYSNSEANSQTGNSTDEILTAASSLVGRVEAVFTPTDNAVMACEGAVAEILNQAGIAHYTGADSFVAAGAFTTSGVNYTELGTYTADMAVDILLGGAVPEYHVMDGGIITVNTDIAEALGIDYSVFKTMANTVTEVTTVE